MGKTKQDGAMTPEMQSAQLSEERSFLTKLFEAALRGEGEQVKKLVTTYSTEHNVPPQEVLSQFKDGSRRTALHFACQSNPTSIQEFDIVPAILDWLPKRGAVEILRVHDKEGLTPLMIAAQHPNPQLAAFRVDTILKTGGDQLALARSRVGATALHYASSRSSRPATIRRLYEAGKVALQANSLQGGTPLHWAAGEPHTDHTENMQALVDCGANVDALNGQGIPSLVLAAAASNDKNAKFLVRTGADCSSILPGNVTVFHIAADLNLVGTLAAMFEANKSLAQDYCKRRNDKGETPLDLAAQEGHVGCVMLLLPEGKNDEETAKTLITEKQLSMKNFVKAEHSAVLREAAQDAKPALTDAVDDEASRLAAKVATMTVSDEDKRHSLELKAKGNAHFAKKEWHKSLESYTAAIEVNPTDSTFYSNRSACLMMLGQPENALRDAVVCRQLRPTWSKAYFRMAVARLELGRYEDAALSAWEGLQQDRENEELQRLLQKCVKKGKKVHQETQSKQKKESLDQDDLR
jgi:ankyrin repeat protein